MKNRIIKINDISDIDPSKATVYDLNNRYIDSEGKIYSLKYNREKKKIEIIRITRAPIGSATAYKQKIIEHRKSNKSKLKTGISNEETEEEESVDAGSEEKTVEPDDFIKETLKIMNTHKNRFNAIINSINNTQIISNIKREESNNFQNIFRNMDLDGIQRLDKVILQHKEMVNYPRSVTYYLSKLDSKSKNYLEMLDDESLKMKFIFLYEMHNAIRNLYRTLQKIITDLRNALEEIDTEELKSITHTDKQKIDDSKTSVKTSLNEIKVILKKSDKISEYLDNETNV